VPGAGKTTFANEFLPIEAECLNFINADLIAQGLSPFQPDKKAIEAGRLMIQNINKCVKLRVSQGGHNVPVPLRLKVICPSKTILLSPEQCP
jgi:predicted ABC-type ATPase